MGKNRRNLSRKEATMPLTPQEQAPLTACQKCQDRPCIKTGKICNEVEALLPKPRSGGHRKEFSCDPHKIEGLAVKRAFELIYGNKYQQVEKHLKHNGQVGEGFRDED